MSSKNKTTEYFDGKWQEITAVLFLSIACILIFLNLESTKIKLEPSRGGMGSFIILWVSEILPYLLALIQCWIICCIWTEKRPHTVKNNPSFTNKCYNVAIVPQVSVWFDGSFLFVHEYPWPILLSPDSHFQFQFCIQRVKCSWWCCRKDQCPLFGKWIYLFSTAIVSLKGNISCKRIASLRVTCLILKHHK